MEQKISGLHYLILKTAKKKSNAGGDDLPQPTMNPDGSPINNSIDNYIDGNPVLKAKKTEIENAYTDYVANPGSKKGFKQWLDEDFYKTDSGKSIFESLGTAGRLFGGLFGNQEAPLMNDTNQKSGSKGTGIPIIWFIIILLGILGALFGLYFVAGRSGSSKKKPIPAVVPAPAPAPAPEIVAAEI